MYKSLKVWYKNRGLLLFVFCMVLQLAISFCLSLCKVKWVPAYISLSCYCAVILFYLFFQWNRATRFDFIHLTSFKPALFAVGNGVLMYVVAMSTVVVVISLLTIIFGSNLPSWFTASNDGFNFFLESKGWLGKTLWILIIVGLGPFVEELMFRGYLQNAVNHHFRDKNLDVFIVATIFALFHYNSLANIIFAFVVGVALSYYSKKNKNILISFIMHACVNGSSLIVGTLAMRLGVGQ